MGYSLTELVLWARDKNLIHRDGEIKKYYTLKDLNLNNDYHFLSSFNFDEEAISFHRKGHIHSVYLKKRTNQPDKMFLEIAEEIAKRYGKFEIKNSKVIFWTSNKNYVIFLNQIEDTILIVCANIKNL